MQIRIKIEEADLKGLVAQLISEKTGAIVDPENVKIEVKSKQNYRSKWEESNFRAVYLSTEDA